MRLLPEKRTERDIYTYLMSLNIPTLISQDLK